MKILACPKCETVLSVEDDMAGGQVRCPQCLSILDVPGTALPPASPIIAVTPQETPARDDEPTPLRPADDEDVRLKNIALPAMPNPWGKVRTGLNLMHFGFCAVIVTSLILLVFGSCVLRSGADDGKSILGSMTGCFVLVVGNGVLLSVLGMVLCISAPDLVARGKMAQSVGCLGLMVVAEAWQFCARANPQMRDGGFGVVLALAVISSFLGLVSAILQVQFLKRLGELFGDARLVLSCSSYVTFQVASAAAMVGLTCVLGQILPERMNIDNALRLSGGVFVTMLLLGAVAIVGGLIHVVWYLKLLAGARHAVGVGTSPRLYYHEKH